MGPVHAHLLDGSLPSLAFVVERHTYDFISLAVVFHVGLHDIGHLLATRATPTGPKVHQHIVALAAPFAQRMGLTVHVLQRQVDEHAPWLAFLQAFGISEGGEHARVLHVGRSLLEPRFDLLIVHLHNHVGKESHRHHRRRIGLEYLVAKAQALFGQIPHLRLCLLSGKETRVYFFSQGLRLAVKHSVQRIERLVAAESHLIEWRPLERACHEIDVYSLAVDEDRDVILFRTHAQQFILVRWQLCGEFSSPNGNLRPQHA